MAMPLFCPRNENWNKKARENFRNSRAFLKL